MSELEDNLIGLFRASLQGVYARLDPDDQNSLAEYARGIAVRTIERRASTDPTRQGQLEQEIAGFEGAINLMADRYLLGVAHEAEKAALEALKITVQWILKILVTAVKL